MLFQTLDDKKQCVGYYANGELFFHSPLPEGLSKTWSYSAFLNGKNIDYAQLYCEGRSLDEVCPDDLKEKWQEANRKLKSVITSCIESKVSLQDNCFFDLTPKKFLSEYCELKNLICERVFSEYRKPKEYEFYSRFSEIIHDIKNRDLQLNTENIKNLLAKEDVRTFYKRIINKRNFISYNLFNSKTGRLTVTKESFPILSFPKSHRDLLIPTNDFYVVLDMNAAEMRTAIALNGGKQMSGDLHEWTAKNVFNGELDRASSKSAATAWLYDSHSTVAVKYDKQLDTVYKKENLLNQYWIDGKIHTPYNRIIEADRHHALSYLMQSTFIDLFHRQIIKVDDALKNKKSFIAFFVHDELVLDVSKEDLSLIPELVNILEDTSYGKFCVNIKAGKTYGNLKKIDLGVR